VPVSRSGDPCHNGVVLVSRSGDPCHNGGVLVSRSGDHATTGGPHHHHHHHPWVSRSGDRATTGSVFGQVCRPQKNSTDFGTFWAKPSEFHLAESSRSTSDPSARVWIFQFDLNQGMLGSKADVRRDSPRRKDGSSTCQMRDQSYS
jgi:hypothetical protein